MAQILIIDDEDQVRALFRRALEQAGHEVVTAPDGNAGCKLYRQHPSDMVICDIIMPDKDGLETIIDLRRTFPTVKIIAISGGGRVSSADYLDMAHKFGADLILEKPVTPQALARAVDRLIGEIAGHQD